MIWLAVAAYCFGYSTGWLVCRWANKSLLEHARKMQDILMAAGKLMAIRLDYLEARLAEEGEEWKNA